MPALQRVVGLVEIGGGRSLPRCSYALTSGSAVGEEAERLINRPRICGRPPLNGPPLKHAAISSSSSIHIIEGDCWLPISCSILDTIFRQFYLTLASTFLRDVYYQFTTLPIPQNDFAGKAIVTGSNTGLGLETARIIAGLNAEKVILAVRHVKEGEVAKEDIDQKKRLKKRVSDKIIFVIALPFLLLRFALIRLKLSFFKNRVDFSVYFV